jgi:pimeloyl-ACP methyl ester carboxylesterase
MKHPRLFALLLAMLPAVALAAPKAAPPPARNVVLVHGAWADGSSWAQVIPYLQKAGLHVTAVQNPLTSLDEDVAATRRVLAQQDGPTVLVGHSYAGSVISQAGDDAKVTALVYVAARAPDAGEDFVALAAKFPAGRVRAGVQTHAGYSVIGEKAFLDDFANGVPATLAHTLYAVQQPIAADLFAGRTTVAAWQNKPSWYAVSREDQTTSPELQRFLAKRMGATTQELDSGHLSLVSHPRQIAEMILQAAGQGAR